MSLKGKTPTFSGHKLHDQYSWNGLKISIENRAGSKRKWTDRHGNKGITTMRVDYGYINRTIGKDGDHIDCFIGPNEDAEKVYVVHQHVDGKHDEDKVMLGFDSAKAAKEMYLKHYCSSDFFGGMTILTLHEFKDKVIGKRIDKIKKAQKFSFEETCKTLTDMSFDCGRHKFNAKQIQHGMNVELEHRNVTHGDAIKTAKIAIAHLKEDPNYYEKLAKIEKSANKWLFKTILIDKLRSHL